MQNETIPAQKQTDTVSSCFSRKAITDYIRKLFDDGLSAEERRERLKNHPYRTPMIF